MEVMHDQSKCSKDEVSTPLISLQPFFVLYHFCMCPPLAKSTILVSTHSALSPNFKRQSLEMHLLLMEWLLVRQPAQQINIKHYEYIALCIPYILFLLGLGLGLGLS